MKKLALTSLLVMSFVATSYAEDSDVIGVTDTHVRTKHMKNGTHRSEVVGAKHTGNAASAETATLFFSGIGKFLDENASKIKELAKSAGKTAIGALNAKVNGSASSSEVSAAAEASSPIGSEG